MPAHIFNALATQIPLPDGFIQTVVTSPPYYGLRSYLKKDDPLKQYEIGNETTPELYIANLVKVFRECWRVLKDDGTLWLNLGDSYSGSGRGVAPNGIQRTNRGTLFSASQPHFVPQGLKPKDLMMLPARGQRDPRQEGE